MVTEQNRTRPVLYVEDVKEGLELPPLVKRPTTLTLFRYSAVTWNAHKIHYDREYVKEEGYPDVLVQGHLHGAYLVQLLTDWMGSQGVLRKFGWSNRRPAFPGDTLSCRGRVTRVYQQDGEHRVELEVWEENQRGEQLVPGTATVALPSRNP